MTASLGNIRSVKYHRITTVLSKQYHINTGGGTIYSNRVQRRDDLAPIAHVCYNNYDAIAKRFWNASRFTRLTWTTQVRMATNKTIMVSTLYCNLHVHEKVYNIAYTERRDVLFLTCRVKFKIKNRDSEQSITPISRNEMISNRISLE